MRLLAKSRSFDNTLKPGLIILILVFFGCQTSNDLGVKYDLGSDANIKFKEFTLPATNIFIDSLRTDGENRVLVGQTTNPLTGSVSAEGYFQYFYEKGPFPKKKNTTDVVYQDTIKLDSIIITFEANEIIPQKGTSHQEFSVYDLKDTLKSVVYLATLKQKAETVLSTFNSSINTETDTIFRMKMEATYAQSFYANLSSKAGDITKTTKFKSLGVLPGPTSVSMTSFDLSSDTSRLIVYSSPVDPDAKDTTYLTIFAFSGKEYSALQRDRSGSEFAGIVEFEDFKLANGKTMIDPLSGISTAISVSGIKDFFDENENILINSAILSLEFEAENDRDTLTQFMNLFRKKDGKIFGPSIISNPFGHIVMSDNGYLTKKSQPATSVLNDGKDKLSLPSTLFYEQLYRYFSKNKSFDYQNPTDADDITAIKEFVNMSTSDVILKRTVFKKDGIKLKFYYTEVDR